MMNLSSPSEIKALLQKNGFNFSKALGQNFLINPSVCPRMAEAAIPGPEYGVIEVGPGIGVLTVELAQRAQKVIAIELDERLYPILDETLADYPNAHVVPGDILEVDLHKLIAEEFTLLDDAGDPVLDESGAPRLMPLVICANLPYYITSPVIMKLLSEDLPIENLTVMVQKEAADRLCADVGTRAAGAVTVAIRYYAEAEQLFFVSKGSFLPAPKVDSEVIRLTLRKDVAGLSPEDADRFFKMVQAGFSQRRKTIMNSFSAALGMNKADLGELLDSVNVPRTARIEQLTMDQLLAVYKASR
ncbi:MAG: ribosomal RNA small subunit methyltransferase A [Clostridia bacterium]|nr:ribosomal RNA small subunit methyltransferase A [Clostridia bacterium]MBQ2568097.1 ribosomal RNA small subunit methyltransferase A [Clostridia bacterium]MBQ3051940.1 ribosomal RNA small subunit methyltransferase A [Clostridia bacterium]MBQ3326338.1 ribosomal RNA small subunit methyltransferase A [Clostridia bacterium]